VKPHTLEKTMTIYFVATRTRYVLVEAEDESTARITGHAALDDLHVDLRRRLGREVPIEIHTVRQATSGEMDLWNWHHEMLAREKNRENNR
jgi:hypothetical protein